MRRRSLVFPTLVTALALAACGSEYDGAGEEEEEIAQTQESLSTIVKLTFENYPPGRLRAPWFVVSDPSDMSRAAIVSTPDHGKALLLYGGRIQPAFATATLRLSSSAREVLAQFEVRPSSNSTFVFELHGAGPTNAARSIRLQMMPGATALVASTEPIGDRPCGAVRPNVWSKVTLVVHTHTSPPSFDVRINGRPTTCNGLHARISPPFNALSIMDPSTNGWGGDVLFDNVLVQTP